MKVKIIGAGVAGSLLAYMLNNMRGIEVELLDLKPSYFKPCGDVVPNIYSPPVEWKIKYRIRKFKFYIDGKEIYDIEYKNTKWVVIDKWEWINRMRSKIKNFKNSIFSNNFSYINNKNKDESLIVYSIGPYFLDREVVYTTRALVKSENFSDEAIIEFDTSKVGFYWIFPEEEGVYNIGAGFIEDKNSKEILLKYLKEKLKRNFIILDVRGAPISIGDVRSKNYRIGEARGLVFPLSGEGIRPSAISAEVAFNAITKNKNLDEYLNNNLKSIEYKIRIQRFLLNLYKNSNISLRKNLLNIFFKNEILIDAYLEDKLDVEGIVDSIRKIRGGEYLLRYNK
ncbi:MAG: NAD(P)/FAD-dependent oxidoreductase [Sulfolobaceae archaeon]